MRRSRTLSWDVSARTLPDAFERYLVGMADLYEVSGVSDDDRLNFFNATRTTLTDMGAIGRGRSVRQTLSRTTAVLRRSDVDGLNIVINRTAMVGDCDGREVRAAPMAVQFRDLGRPAASRLDTVDLHTLLMPRTVVPPALLGREVHGLVLAPDQPVALLMTAHMDSLQALAETLADAELEAGVQALMIVATRAVGGAAGVGGPELAALQSTVRRAAAEFIEARLAEGQVIDAGAVALAAGVSRATLYRAFDSEGGVGRFIQDRRLHRARSALRRRQDQPASIAAIARDAGFASASHFSRLFRERFGYSPSDVEPLRPPADFAMSTGPIRHDLLVNWLKTFPAG